jgi:ankyrin repeat protein
MTAVTGGWEKTVQTLLENQPNIEAKDQNGETALRIAAKMGFKSIVDLLLKQGAACVEGYSKGETPEHVATEFEILEVLRQKRCENKRFLDHFKKDPLEDK